jgi:hypothetical protein
LVELTAELFETCILGGGHFGCWCWFLFGTAPSGTIYASKSWLSSFG